MNFSKQDFSYRLPQELIALEPHSPRDESRLLWVQKHLDSFADHSFLDLPRLLPANSLIIANNTKVIPARLQGNRASGGQIEALLVQETASRTWTCKVKNSSRLKIGEKIFFSKGALEATLLEKNPKGLCLLRFGGEKDLFELFEALGHPPLPPYILAARGEKAAQETDKKHYQTLFAESYGAVAAPTAGLHFTERAKNLMEEAGHEFLEITLHVGLGTFEPLRADDLTQHQMHSEEYEISVAAASKINQAKSQGRPILAVGTTSLRALEASASRGRVTAGRKSTDIFIYPPYEFQIPSHLLTNFHLPESTLLMLVAAFAGKEKILHAYQQAIEKKYRFYSYGDCMLIG